VIFLRTTSASGSFLSPFSFSTATVAAAVATTTVAVAAEADVAAAAATDKVSSATAHCAHVVAQYKKRFGLNRQSRKRSEETSTLIAIPA